MIGNRCVFSELHNEKRSLLIVTSLRLDEAGNFFPKSCEVMRTGSSSFEDL